MTFKEYQKEAIKCAQYPEIGNNIRYPLLGLIGETGEVAEKFKKMIRDDGGVLSDERRLAIQKELGDVLWYTQAVAYERKANYDIDFQHGYEHDRDAFGYIMDIAHCSTILSEVEIDPENYLHQIIRCLSCLAFVVGSNLEDIATQNLDKLFDRLERGVIKGDGDNR